MNELQKEALELGDMIDCVGVQIANGEFEYEQLKSAQIQLEISVDLGARDNAAVAGTKVTEKLIENIVQTNPNVISQQAKIQVLKRDLSILKASLEGLRTKRDMITAISRMGE